MTIKLEKYKKDKEIDIKMYRGIIRSLLCLTISIPNIIFSICLYARFQSYPKESHLFLVKSIFCYLSGPLILAFGIIREHILI